MSEESSVPIVGRITFENYTGSFTLPVKPGQVIAFARDAGSVVLVTDKKRLSRSRMVEWIKSSERLPEDRDYVLVLYLGGEYHCATYRLNEDVWLNEKRECGTFYIEKDWSEESDLGKITHWMPFPAPPEEA